MTFSEALIPHTERWQTSDWYVECMDEGSKEGFLYILKIILDNDLLSCFE